ncbi:MBL fold metallo-hydrolase [Phycisphaerales bacterium AB-hyl4]|uniref:MBL fold metallo-hydrolase n=1 Tax=Natronomicrosphaera hydrolytica TaxID=3242702 RepID=A0ABV4U5X3_9BACT
MSIELLFLGTGTSAGIPMIGCDCEVCRSDDPRDQRSRCSILVRYPDAATDEDAAPPTRQLLIDTAPEIRLQAVHHRLDRLDGVLYTHAHADHIFGIDDLRRFNAVMRAPLDIYAEPGVIQTLQRMFPHIFASHKNVNPSFVANLITRPITVEQPLDLYGATWTPLRLMHGRLPIVGYHIDYHGRRVAYCTDVSTIPPETLPHVTDLDVLILDALRYRHHPTHLTVEQALDLINHLRPKQAYLTHIAHDIRHADLEDRLPDNVHLAYDNLHLTLTEPLASH